MSDFFKKIEDFLKSYSAERERAIREETEKAGMLFVNGYDGGEKFHCSNEQYYRFKRALASDKIGRVVRVNRKKRTMLICSSYKRDVKYHVTLTKCDCEDFKQRNLPCKHMYRLALELGVVTPEWDLTGLSEDEKKSIESLTKTSVQRLLKLMDANRKSHNFECNLRSVPAQLFEHGFIEDKMSLGYSLDKYYKKDELIAMLKSGCSECGIGFQNKKAEIIQYIIENEPKLAKTLYKEHAYLSFSDSLIENFDCIYRYCEHILGLLDPWLDYA